MSYLFGELCSTASKRKGLSNTQLDWVVVGHIYLKKLSSVTPTTALSVQEAHIGMQMELQ
jgi:hypothetical protein